MANVQRHRVGDAEIVSLQDTWASVPPALFFPDVPASAWDEYREFLDGDGNITLNIGAWVVISEGKRILVDTGIGGRPGPLPARAEPCLPQGLEEIGLAPDEIDIVVYSHLHFDHTGWNTVDREGRPALLFPHARHVVQEAEWEYWTSTADQREASRYEAVLKPVEDAGLLDLVMGEYSVTPELVTVPTPGHTPGHVSFVVASGGERAYIIGDAAHQPVQVLEDGWSPGADVDPVASSQSRRELFARIEREGALLASGHFAFPGLGRVVRQGQRRLFVPLEPETV